MSLKRGRRPDGTGNQIAAAIRAFSAENSIGATRAERAFKRADSGVRRIRRQISIAALAARSDFQHSALQDRYRASLPFLGKAVKGTRAIFGRHR